MKLEDLKVDGEFRDLIMPLSKEEFEQLEANIIDDGEVREPIVTWNGVIIDGHNRYTILQKHPEIPYKTREMIFLSRNEALLWIINNQLGRRNLNKADAILLAQRKAEITAVEAKEKQREAGGDKRSDEYKETAYVKNDKSGSEPISTRNEVAKLAGVSTGTVAQFEQVQKKKPELIDKIRKGEMTVGGAYKEVKREERKADKVESAENLSDDAISGELTAIENEPVYKAPAYTVDDLIKEVNSGADNYVRFLKQTLVNRSTTYADPADRKKVYDAISNLIGKIEDIQKLLK